MQLARPGPVYAGPPTSSTSRYRDYEEPSGAQMHHDQRQRNDYHDDHLYYSHQQQQQQHGESRVQLGRLAGMQPASACHPGPVVHTSAKEPRLTAFIILSSMLLRIAMLSVAPQPYTPQNNAASSSSDSEYFSYSSDASMAPIASSSTYNGYRSFEALDSAIPGPSSASSIPFQPSAPASASLDVEDLFGFADDDSRAEAQTLEASATQIGNKQDGARSRASTSAAASGGHASDSSLSSEVASNPLLRQDLHKNGMCLSLLATRQYLS